MIFPLFWPAIGFGFSDPSAKEGMDSIRVARMFKELLLRLGHEKFYTQAGDWGAAITMAMAILYPENVLGYHTNFSVALQSCLSFQ